ncbi:hypothetical protein CERZMDRAFT_107565 [Cercospora zeae-maydis SCOH1-5]|uniref:Uncharacterized protein n=1 Tax=Cercospora zeae-maydis SCOH1-5 TaxID=717836 RepID=A0A6A6F3F5_9PEZI|nr:hypothetical protein CERZMDRAFT_107565 [Cercospora zeae-maydis SCOH1-5]
MELVFRDTTRSLSNLRMRHAGDLTRQYHSMQSTRHGQKMLEAYSTLCPSLANHCCSNDAANSYMRSSRTPLHEVSASSSLDFPLTVAVDLGRNENRLGDDLASGAAGVTICRIEATFDAQASTSSESSSIAMRCTVSGRCPVPGSTLCFSRCCISSSLRTYRQRHLNTRLDEALGSDSRVAVDGTLAAIEIGVCDFLFRTRVQLFLDEAERCSRGCFCGSCSQHNLIAVSPRSPRPWVLHLEVQSCALIILKPCTILAKSWAQISSRETMRSILHITVSAARHMTRRED